MVEKYYNKNGSLGVLISPGFGVGWSTWENKNLAYDKRIIEYWLAKTHPQTKCATSLKSWDMKLSPWVAIKI